MFSKKTRARTGQNSSLIINMLHDHQVERISNCIRSNNKVYWFINISSFIW